MGTEQAEAFGIRRVYNQTSDIDYMHIDDIDTWINGLVNRKDGEACLVENALKNVEGNALYITTCIVFVSQEFCNMYFLRHKDLYKDIIGFGTLMN